MYKMAIQLLALVVVAVVVGCSPTSKILKSNDPWLIYDHAYDLYEKEEWKKADKVFESVESYYIGGMKEDSIAFFRARCAFKQNNFDAAKTMLDEFRRRYGRSAFIEDAEGMYTLSHYYMAPAVTRDQSLSQLAILTINEFISRYPNSEQREIFEGLIDELQGRIHEKSFLNAYTYYKIGQYKSSIVAFRNALKEFPESEYREDILYYTTLSAFDLARNSILSKKESRYMSMIDSYFTFIAEYPESKYRKDADRMLAKAREYIAGQNAIREAGGVGDDKLAEEEGIKVARKAMAAERKAQKEDDKLRRLESKSDTTEQTTEQTTEN